MLLQNRHDEFALQHRLLSAQVLLVPVKSSSSNPPIGPRSLVLLRNPISKHGGMNGAPGFSLFLTLHCWSENAGVRSGYMFESSFLNWDWTTSKLCELNKSLSKNPSDLVEVHKCKQVHSLKFQPYTHKIKITKAHVNINVVIIPT